MTSENFACTFIYGLRYKINYSFSRLLSHDGGHVAPRRVSARTGLNISCFYKRRPSIQCSVCDALETHVSFLLRGITESVEVVDAHKIAAAAQQMLLL